MNFYPFHIGDYVAHTAHLEPMEDLAYRRMMDMYYVREGELPLAVEDVAKLIRMRSDVVTVKAVLDEFFEQTATGWFHKRCDYEISEMQCKRMNAKESAAKRWQSDGNANAMRTHTEGNATNTNTNTKSKSKEESKSIGAYPDDFEEVWNEYPSRPGASKKDAFKAWNARIANGVTALEMLTGARRYAAYCQASRTEPQYIKQPTTFFGPGEHYRSDWSIPQQARASPLNIHDARKNVIDVLTGRGDKNGSSNERDITGESFRVANG